MVTAAALGSASAAALWPTEAECGPAASASSYAGPQQSWLGWLLSWISFIGGSKQAGDAQAYYLQVSSNGCQRAARMRPLVGMKPPLGPAQHFQAETGQAAVMTAPLPCLLPPSRPWPRTRTWLWSWPLPSPSCPSPLATPPRPPTWRLRGGRWSRTLRRCGPGKLQVGAPAAGHSGTAGAQPASGRKRLAPQHSLNG